MVKYTNNEETRTIMMVVLCTLIFMPVEHWLHLQGTANNMYAVFRAAALMGCLRID